MAGVVVVAVLVAMLVAPLAPATAIKPNDFKFISIDSKGVYGLKNNRQLMFRIAGGTCRGYIDKSLLKCKDLLHLAVTVYDQGLTNVTVQRSLSATVIDRTNCEFDALVAADYYCYDPTTGHLPC